MLPSANPPQYVTGALTETPDLVEKLTTPCAWAEVATISAARVSAILFIAFPMFTELEGPVRGYSHNLTSSNDMGRPPGKPAGKWGQILRACSPQRRGNLTLMGDLPGSIIELSK